MSRAGSAASTVAAETVSSAKVTWMLAASFTTCSAVRMVASALTTTPVPEKPPVPFAASASMVTTDGASAW